MSEELVQCANRKCAAKNCFHYNSHKKISVCEENIEGCPPCVFVNKKEKEIEVYKVVRKVGGCEYFRSAWQTDVDILYHIGKWVSPPYTVQARGDLLTCFDTLENAKGFINGNGILKIYKALAKGISNQEPTWVDGTYGLPTGTIMCREIKLIEEVKEERTYRVGNRFRDKTNNEIEYILVECGRDGETVDYIQLTSLEDGVGYWYPKRVADKYNITQKELCEICGHDENNFELIGDNECP